MHKASKWLTVLLSISMATAAYAAPTAIAERPAAAVCTLRPSDYADTPAAAANVTEVAEASNCHLANIAHELLKPPGDSIDSPVPAVAATSLPAVPGALFMGLTGFLCVSLVRDRKLWIAALAGLLWAGQAGVTVLPQVAHHLAGRRHATQCFSPNVAYVPTLDHSDRPRSLSRAKSRDRDIEGTRYICLLRYLAGIPDGSLQSTSLRAQRSNLRNQRNTQYDIRHTSKSLQFALARLYAYILCASNCLVYITKRHAYFSPAFIFENLARGPPSQTWKRFFLLRNFDLQSVFAKTLFRLL
jgi:hypothetical protein